MNRKWLGLLAVLSLLIPGITGCSGGNDPGARADRIESQTNPTAKAIREYSQAPINKARAAVSLGDDRLEAMDQAAKGANP